MTAERNKIREAAEKMVQRFGDDAIAEADQRIEELGSCGEAEAQDLWKRIREVLELLLGDASDKTKH